MGIFSSFETPEQVRVRFSSKLLPWNVLEDSKTDSSTRPPFHQYRVTIANYESLGQTGDLNLRFFNDRLMEVRFFPTDFDLYSEALRREGIELTPEQRIPPYTRVWTSMDFDDRRFVGWVDTRLEKEMKDWIRKYA